MLTASQIFIGILVYTQRSRSTPTHFRQKNRFRILNLIPKIFSSTKSSLPSGGRLTLPCLPESATTQLIKQRISSKQTRLSEFDMLNPSLVGDSFFLGFAGHFPNLISRSGSRQFLVSLTSIFNFKSKSGAAKAKFYIKISHC